VTAPLGVQSRPFRAGELDVVRLGRAPFDAVGALREHLLELRLAREVCDTLILCEHDALVTVGRGLLTAAIAQLSIPVVEVSPAGFHDPVSSSRSPSSSSGATRPSRSGTTSGLRDPRPRELEIGERKPGAAGVWVSDRRLLDRYAAARGIGGVASREPHADSPLEPFRAVGRPGSHGQRRVLRAARALALFSAAGK
jgi:hypothetical protein